MKWRDVTDEPLAGSADHPEVVRALEMLRFRVVGHLLADPGVSPAEIAAPYAEPDRTWLVEHYDHPETVLRDEDATMFAGVSAFYGGPAVRLRTLLQDGHLVETLEQWARLPKLNPELLPWGHQQGLVDQQLRGRARGRSIEVVDTSDVRELLGAHREHVKRVAGDAEPILHDDLELMATINRDAYAHTEAVLKRGGKIGMAVLVSSLPLVLALVLALVWMGRTPAAVLALVAAAVGVGNWGPQYSTWLAIRIVRWFPPPFT